MELTDKIFYERLKMKGDKIYKILDFLEDKTMDMVDFASSFLAAGYGASMGKRDYEFKKRNRNRENYKIDRQEKRRLEKYIYELKVDGLLREDSAGKINLSPKGKKKIKHLRKNRVLGKDLYQKETSSKVTIISYDLPVSFNRERDMLRTVLKVLGFHMIHKSVWVGKVKVPKSFLAGLQKLKILRYVEILEVTKHGSLKQYR